MILGKRKQLGERRKQQPKEAPRAGSAAGSRVPASRRQDGWWGRRWEPLPNHRQAAGPHQGWATGEDRERRQGMPVQGIDQPSHGGGSSDSRYGGEDKATGGPGRKGKK